MAEMGNFTLPLTKPTLKQAERVFCSQQKAICLAHLKPKVATPPAPALLPAVDCGPRSLLLACQSLRVPASLEDLTKAAGTVKTGSSFAGLKHAAESIGLKAEGVQVSRQALPTLTMPALAWVHENHYIAVLSVHGSGERGTAVVHDPNDVVETTISQERLLQMTGGYLLIVRR